jgi:O-succinylbenzoic acid--CoA ligase
VRLSIEAAARDAPDRIAIAIAGDEALTYRALRDRARAWRFRFADVRTAAVVGCNTVETIASILALIEGGVPFAVVHPRWTAADRERAIAQVGADLVVEGGRVEQRRAKFGGPALPDRDPVAPHEGLAIFSTSGTTGTPKGAVLTEDALVACASGVNRRLAVTPEDRWILALPIAHVGGFAILVRCLLARATVLLEPRFDADRFVEALGSATLASVVPTMVHRLEGRRMPRGLRAMLVGGAPLDPPAEGPPSRWRAELPILETYGLTEAASTVAIDGAPLEGVEVDVLEGRIHVRGSTLFRGYVGERPHEGWFDTGDLGRIEGRRLELRGRRSDLILSGGENVYPAEVEAALKRCPGIAGACVVGTPDPEWGEVVSAALVAGDEPPTAAMLEAHIDGALAGYQRPRRMTWIAALPETPSGKIDRTSVRRLFA